jgi:cyanate lyase
MDASDLRSSVAREPHPTADRINIAMGGKFLPRKACGVSEREPARNA